MLRYRVIDYYSGKAIEGNSFDSKEEAKEYQRQHHKYAVENKIAVHNWLTLVEEFDTEHGEECSCKECETCFHCGGKVGMNGCEHC